MPDSKLFPLTFYLSNTKEDIIVFQSGKVLNSDHFFHYLCCKNPEVMSTEKQYKTRIYLHEFYHDKFKLNYKLNYIFDQAAPVLSRYSIVYYKHLRTSCFYPI